MKLSVIIPSYNEEKTIGETIGRVNAISLDKEIIVVDDGSTDVTGEILDKISEIKVLHHSTPLGKGTSIRDALRFVTGDIVIIQDADLEYDPADYSKLVEPIIYGRASVVYGSRFKKRAWPEGMRFQNFLANKILAIATNLLYLTNITDEATAYKTFKSDLLKSINLKCKAFEFCPEVTAKILKRGIKIYEVPVSYRARETGAKIRWWDGFIALWTLLKYRFVD